MLLSFVKTEMKSKSPDVEIKSFLWRDDKTRAEMQILNFNKIEIGTIFRTVVNLDQTFCEVFVNK